MAKKKKQKIGPYFVVVNAKKGASIRVVLRKKVLNRYRLKPGQSISIRIGAKDGDPGGDDTVSPPSRK